MWETLIKWNPKLIKNYKSKKNFKYLLGIAMNKGYLPTADDIYTNKNLLDYFHSDYNIQRLKKLIDNDPRCVILVRIAEVELINYALEKGYKPTVEDFKYNRFLCMNDEIMSILIEQDPQNIVHYNGENDELVKIAIEKGYNPTVNDIRLHPDLSRFDDIVASVLNDNPANIVHCSRSNPKFIKMAIDKGYTPTMKDIEKYPHLCKQPSIIEAWIEQDPKNIVHYNGVNDELVKIAIEKGYNPTVKDLKKNSSLARKYSVMKELVEKTPDAIKYASLVQGEMEQLFKVAMEKGYEPSMKHIKNNYELAQCFSVFEYLVEKEPSCVKYYIGYSKGISSLIDKAISKGYVPTMKDIKESEHLSLNYSAMKAAIEANPATIELCLLSQKDKVDELVKIAINLGYVPTKIKENSTLSYSDFFMRPLIEENPTVIELYNGNNPEIIKLAIDNGYIPSIDILEKCPYARKNDYIMQKLIDKNVNCILLYEGNNEEIIKSAIAKGYVPTQLDAINNKYFRKSDLIMEKLLENDLSNILLYQGNNEEFIMKAIKIGYIPQPEHIPANPNLGFSDLIMDNLLRQSSNNLNLYKCCDENSLAKAISKFNEIYNVNVPLQYAEVLQVYKYDICEFAINYEQFSNFLSDLGIDENRFVQYAFSKSYKWISDIKQIIDSNKLNEFNQVKDYFFKSYYFDNKKETNVLIIDSFVNILENYVKYPELCVDMMNKKVELSEQEKSNIAFLFDTNSLSKQGDKPNKFSDVLNIPSMIKADYETKLNEYDKLSAPELKDLLCEIIFHSNASKVTEILSIYGNVQDLKLLEFYNKKFPDLQQQIRNITVYTSVLETINNISSNEELKNLIRNALTNFDEVVNLSMCFKDYENKMRKLYENDLLKNVTKFEKIKDQKLVLDEEKTLLYGVDTIDYSDKRYCVLTHVMSKNESPEELISGVASGNKNFISLTPISNRNQVYYQHPDENKIIFATDQFQEGSFIQSGVTNIGSNRLIKFNNSEFGQKNDRIQRGIIETSQAIQGKNSEILAYREGIPFKYIILPGGREPTERELSIAKEYNLKFIITQDVRTTINVPKEIEMKNEVTILKEDDKTVQYLPTLLEVGNDKPKSIAILTDAHGLFEPTLAVLEDARQKGITEIYSLGDNIGSGPNPSEVMKLLDEYGVTSIAGNHELYISLGVDEFKEHLCNASQHAYNEAKSNSEWTSNQLSTEQKEKLRFYDRLIELTIGGKNILLCHDIKDFNTGKIIVDPKIYDEVFRGHIHFSQQENNVTTIPGVGIGTNTGKAAYMVLTENKQGGYTCTPVVVPYNRDSLKYSIIESNMDLGEREKIERWSGINGHKKNK